MSERQLEEANAANRENRRIIAGLIERILELEAPASEAPEPQNRGQDAGSRSDRV